MNYTIGLHHTASGSNNIWALWPVRMLSPLCRPCWLA